LRVSLVKPGAYLSESYSGLLASFPPSLWKSGQAHPGQWKVRCDSGDPPCWRTPQQARGSTSLAGRTRRVVPALLLAVVPPRSAAHSHRPVRKRAEMQLHLVTREIKRLSRAKICCRTRPHGNPFVHDNVPSGRRGRTPRYVQEGTDILGTASRWRH
jgi:hypothetical protein